MMKVRRRHLVFLVITTLAMMLFATVGSAHATYRGLFRNYANYTYSGCNANIDTPPSAPSANTHTVKACVQGKEIVGGGMQVGWKYLPGADTYPRAYAQFLLGGSWHYYVWADASYNWNDYPGNSFSIRLYYADNSKYDLTAGYPGGYKTAISHSGSQTDWQTQQWCAGIRIYDGSQRCYSDVGFGTSGQFRLWVHPNGPYVNNSYNGTIHETYIVYPPPNLYQWYAGTWKTTTW